MATPNYSYEKRQKELAKKRKKEDKLKRKAEGKPDEADEADDGSEGGEDGSLPQAEPGASDAPAA